ncbi:hypothetical protein HGRIS_001387 [Hohenbuehelia grisea]|uniref:Uncharacterized protein n=1 Tax=Hohenbuehelia grisea TaxID=104357 RepID=A0ABR3JP54_9AGAR
MPFGWKPRTAGHHETLIRQRWIVCDYTEGTAAETIANCQPASPALHAMTFPVPAQAPFTPPSRTQSAAITPISSHVLPNLASVGSHNRVVSSTHSSPLARGVREENGTVNREASFDTVDLQAYFSAYASCSTSTHMIYSLDST